MKEITRIHIAKIAYDVEIDAKKDIEDYINALERYASDPEIFDDIEIRITELLAEGGVAAGGVISKNDVANIRAQLGEPSDFTSESAEELVDGRATIKSEPRRIYRDESDAIVGGVLSGLAKYLGIDPIWSRLVFVVILLASFGTALVVYLVLWLIIPPAHTAAEKLTMNGRAVTLAAIKDIAGTEEQRSEKARVVRRVLSVFTGAVLVMIAVAGLLAILAVVFGVQFGLGWAEFAPASDGWMYESWWFMAMMALFILSGLLFSALCFILANAAFRRSWSRRIGTAVTVIIVAGIVVFAGGVGAAFTGYASEENRILQLQETRTGELPVNFNNIKKLTMEEGGDSLYGPIQYHVSDRSYYELSAMPGIEPEIEVAEDGLSATVRLVRIDSEWSAWDSDGRQTWRPWHSLAKPILTIYGPALETIVANNQTALYGSDYGNGQESLSVELKDDTDFTLMGDFEKVTITGHLYSVASLENAAIGELYTDGGRVTAAVVRQLSVRQPDVCPGISTSLLHEIVRVRAVSGGDFIFNGEKKPAQTVQSGCGEVIISSEESVERD